MFYCLFIIIIIIITYSIYACARTMHVSYAYEKDNGRRTDEGMGTVIARVDTAPRYTLHPPIIRAYCSLRPLLRFRSVLACLRNSRAVFFKEFLAAFFSSRHWQLETEPSDKLCEVSGPPLDVATNPPLALNENARSVLVPDWLRGKIVVDFWQFPALPNGIGPLPNRRSVKGGNLLLVFTDSLDSVLLVHSNTHFPPLMRALIVD